MAEFEEQYCLFGKPIEIKKPKQDVKAIEAKASTKSDEELEEDRIEKLLKSKKTNIHDKLRIITDKVLSVLGKQRERVRVIYDKQQYIDYVNKAIKVGRIAIDTETNNTTDPTTCKLMGLCLYVPGEKQAYIPVNHRDPDTKIRLAKQLTEADIKEGLKLMVDAKKANCLLEPCQKDFDDQTFDQWYIAHPDRRFRAAPFIVMHNGKFDYEVIKCTCGIEVIPDWDTMIAARLINENEHASLKEQYIKYIDKTQAKYKIDKLFAHMMYADVDPEVFALYAATDSLMTDKLYLHQQPIMETEKEYNEDGTLKQHGLYWLFTEIEMPITIVTAEMELTGVNVDRKLGERLKLKYDAQLEATTKKLDADLITLNKYITEWRLDPNSGANERSRQYEPKSKKAKNIEERYPLYDEKLGKHYKEGKAKSEQLEDPVNLDSPTQLAVIIYDILCCPTVSKKAPRGVGSNELKAIQKSMQDFLDEHPEEELNEEDLENMEETDGADDATAEDVEFEAELTRDKAILANDIVGCILTRRGIKKLISTYIDVIPTLTEHWPDHRIRFHLNSLGTDTGRYSSGGKLNFNENDEELTVSGINIQNIPSHNKEIRMLFEAKTEENIVEAKDDHCFTVSEIEEVETTAGWKFAKDLVIGDVLVDSDGTDTIKSITKFDNEFMLFI